MVFDIFEYQLEIMNTYCLTVMYVYFSYVKIAVLYNNQSLCKSFTQLDFHQTIRWLRSNPFYRNIPSRVHLPPGVPTPAAKIAKWASDLYSTNTATPPNRRKICENNCKCNQYDFLQVSSKSSLTTFNTFFKNFISTGGLSRNHYWRGNPCYEVLKTLVLVSCNIQCEETT